MTLVEQSDRLPSWTRAFANAFKDLAENPELSADARVLALGICSAEDGILPSASEISRMLGVPRTTVFYAVKRLASMGFLEPVGANKARVYRVSPYFCFTGDSDRWATATRRSRMRVVK